MFFYSIKDTQWKKKSRWVIKIIYSEKAFIDKNQPGYDMQKCWWDDSAPNDILFKFIFLAVAWCY